MTPEERAEIWERYGWKEGEQEALLRDLAERKDETPRRKFTPRRGTARTARP